MSFEELAAEYRTVGIGPLILSEIRELAWAITRSYDPVVYAHVPSWNEGIDDLVQEFGVEVLIAQGQLDYAMLMATDHTHFRRLLALQLRHLLARRRRRTVVDNLLFRSRQLVAEPPFRLLAHRSEWSYTLSGKELEPGRLISGRLRELAGRLAAVPMIRCAPKKRAPVVYTEQSLRTILETAAGSVDCAVRSSDLDRIFRLLLTVWIPSFVNRGEEAVSRAAAETLDAEKQVIVKEVTRTILGSCDVTLREVLNLKLSGVSDREIGERLGLSRPTVSKRKREMHRLLESAMDGLAEALRLAVMDRLVVALLRVRGV
jgi:DNA-binding NarL/FixJ family response regulator